jgi:hypothetical protein
VLSDFNRVMILLPSRILGSDRCGKSDRRNAINERGLLGKFLKHSTTKTTGIFQFESCCYF